MPQKSWAVGEEVLAADFNTYLQNQVVPAFTTTTQRDAQWTAPPNGALCVTTDTNTLWQRIASSWSTPNRTLHHGALGASVTGVGTAGTDIAISSSIALPAGRRIAVVVHYYMTGSGTFPAIGVKQDGFNQGYAVIVGVAPGGGIVANGEYVLTPTAGSHTFGTYAIILGTGTMSVDATQAGWFEVRDLGAI